MRHKQRPIKSSRHKSVTSLSGDYPQTSFEHNNTRHMNDVMRLAFLENNDISAETWKDVDFNSLSTASILKRNIQQQLQQQLKEQQLQAKQQQQLLQQQQQLLDQQQQAGRQQQNFFENPQQPLQHLRARQYEGGVFVVDGDGLEDEELNDPDQSHQLPSYDDEEDEMGRYDLIHMQNHNNQHHGLDDHLINNQTYEDEVGPATNNRATTNNHYGDSDNRIFATAMPTTSYSRNSSIATSHNNSTGDFLCDEPDCGKSFPSLRKLRHHKVVHSDDFPFHCQFKDCKKKFKRKFGIDLHSTTHFDLDPEMYTKTSNNSSLPFFGRRMQYSMCKPCGVKFKTVHDYQHHMLNHGKEPFKCPVKGCGQAFSIWKSFQKHRASHYFNYYCKMDSRCEHYTSNLQLLKLHIYCCHFQRKLPENATLASNDEPPVAEAESVIEEEDEEMSSPVVGSSRANKRPNNSAASSPMKQSPEKKLKCDPIEEEEEELFEEDSYSINDSKSFKAKEVPASPIPQSPPTPPQLAPAHQLQQRQRENRPSLNSTPTHPDESTKSHSMINQSNCGDFLCDEPDCGKSFPSLRKLRHHKVVHSDDFPFHCQFRGCEKKFKRKFGIDLHSTTHFDLDQDMYNKTSNSSSLPFFGRRMQYSMCKPCGVKFKTVHDYQHHMLNHGKEPFKCPVKDCGQTFSIWKSFQKHRASHYFNYYCKMDSRCEHYTSNLQLLKLHIYCCHFQRKLPENATLSSKDSQAQIDESTTDIVSQASPSNKKTRVSTPSSQHQQKQTPEKLDSKHSPLKVLPKRACVSSSTPNTRSSSRLSALSLSEKPSPSKMPLKVLPKRACVSSANSTPIKQQQTSSQSTSSPEKRSSLPLKILPKRNAAKRLPMSLIAADGISTEEDEEQDEFYDGYEHDNGMSETDSFQNDRGSSNGMDNNGEHCEDGFKCHLCDYKFSVKFQLTKHLSTHLELSPDMYSATADTKVLQISERSRREFHCDRCNLKFEQMSDLDSHMVKHGPRPYVCTFCPTASTFRLAKQYLSHLYEHRFTYKCTMEPDCDFSINRKDALKLHIFRMHMNQKLPEYIENFANMVDCNE